MPYPNEHAARVREPSAFEPDSIRTKSLKHGVRIIIGKLKGGVSMVTQAYRFPVDLFTPEEAKSWLEENKVTYLKFEPAQNNPSELKHYGVLGMRWGRRSGSTGRSSSKSSRASKKRYEDPSEDYATSREILKKPLHKMSNDEIKKVAARLDLENRYKNLNPSRVKRGEKKVKNTLAVMSGLVGAAGTIAATAALGEKIYKAAKNKTRLVKKVASPFPNVAQVLDN